MGTFQIDFGHQDQGPVVGIDLGTTNSLVAVMEHTGPRIIPGEDGDKRHVESAALHRSGKDLVQGCKFRRYIGIEFADVSRYGTVEYSGSMSQDRQSMELTSFSRINGNRMTRTYTFVAVS